MFTRMVLECAVVEEMKSELMNKPPKQEAEHMKNTKEKATPTPRFLSTFINLFFLNWKCNKIY